MHCFALNIICFFILLTTLIGCDSTGRFGKTSDSDPDFVPCAGMVLLDGKPLAGAEVRMKNSRGRSFGNTDENGRFRMKSSHLSIAHDGTWSGTMLVAVLKRVPIDPTQAGGAQKNILPRKYDFGETSGIKFVLPFEGTEDAVIEIFSDPDSKASESADDAKAENPPAVQN